MADALGLLSSYIQIDTTNPPGNETVAAHWLAEQLSGLGVTDDIEICDRGGNRGLLIARLAGADKGLRPLLLNHHMDVVGADPAQWSHAPFSGAIEDGFVYGRGALDTKNLGIIFLLALAALRDEGFAFRRPVIFLAVPDEETGGDVGMRWLVEEQGKTLNPEWVWDEGGGGFEGFFGPGVAWGITVAEKQVHQVRLTAAGKPGHASMPHRENPNDRLIAAVGRVLAEPRPMRTSTVTHAMFTALAPTQKFPASFLMSHLNKALPRKLAAGQLSGNAEINAFLRDTVSLTILRSGYKANVIPEKAVAELDCRLLPDTDPAEFDAWLARQLADPNISVEITEASPQSGVAPVDGPMYRAIEKACAKHVPNSIVFPMQVPGATDGRYWRSRGYAAYGFSPVVLSRADLASVHGIDERISAINMELGVRMAQDVIRELCG
jgi:acetylornithine deacetylase/succinyl-diaminopimelate desuccinylase-like protein